MSSSGRRVNTGSPKRTLPLGPISISWATLSPLASFQVRVSD
jgi:hypothetical protein